VSLSEKPCAILTVDAKIAPTPILQKGHPIAGVN
jgi:hypothetical protein